MGTEEKARREIVEAGMAEIEVAKRMADEAVRHARTGAAMVAHMAEQSVFDEPESEADEGPSQAKRSDHHR